MSEPRVTCIVPVFNGERYLAETIHSILAQTRGSPEVTVVDDGSVDGTRAVVREFGGRVSYLYQANAGPSAARNAGLAAASGEYVAFLDADDLWTVDKLERQLPALGERADLGFCLAHAQNFWMSADLERVEAERDPRRASPIPAYVPGTLLARREVFARLGPFDPTLLHSSFQEWYLRAGRSGVMGIVLPDVLLLRRMHEESYSRASVAASQAEFLKIVKMDLDLRRSARAASPAATTGGAAASS